MKPQCSAFKVAFKAKDFFTPWHPHDSSEHCLPGGGSVSIKGQEETGVMPQGPETHHAPSVSSSSSKHYGRQCQLGHCWNLYQTLRQFKINDEKNGLVALTLYKPQTSFLEQDN